MKKYILITFILLEITLVYGQKQGNVWYFGNQAGMDFNSGTPIALTNGQTYLQNGHAEGTSMICDSSGALLFYTNGEKIWNKNHAVMPNGDSIYGSYSSTQSSLIIPLPGSNQIFYVFTLDDFNHNMQWGFRYSTIDICLSEGLGDVIHSKKNIFILDTAGEKLTAIRHSNGIDYWVIVHKYLTNSFYSYLFTANGLSTNPVITNIGSVHTVIPSQALSGAIGNMKASPNGNRIALVSDNGGKLREIFDFDKSTGVVSNFINLHTDLDSNDGSYGVSFSPDNSKLYISWNTKILQYDLSAGGGNPIAIRNSKTIINPSVSSNNYGLQLGPDQKIYVTEYGSPSLSIINNPNLAGLSCNYTSSAISLLGNNCSFGLPNLIDSYDYSNTTFNCTLGIQDDILNNKITISPNPFSDQTIIKSASTFRNATLTVINCFGQTIQKIKNISGNQIVFSRNNLSNGIYSFRLIEESKIIGIGKFVLVDF